jgi:hypothetical protein
MQDKYKCMNKKLFLRSLGLELKSKLIAAPDPDPSQVKVSKFEIINMISDDIKSLQKRGYTLSQISDLITDGGLEISETTLKSYLKRRGNKGATRKSEVHKADRNNNKKEVFKKGKCSAENGKLKIGKEADI